VGFDGSSIRGFQEISESDMLLVPDPATALIDPFHEQPTLSLVCDVRDPVTGDWYSRDPRHIARKAECHLRDTGIADTAYFGPEAEFYIFDHVAYGQEANRGFYEVDSHEGYWNAGAGLPRTALARSPTSRIATARSRATSRRRRSTRSPTCAAA